jgi:hypothetical protein
MTREGAAEVTRRTLTHTLDDFDLDLSCSRSDAPEADWYVLETGPSDARRLSVVVRVPPKDANDEPDVDGALYGEPFEEFRHSIGLLGDHLLVVLHHRHYRHGKPPVGELTGLLDRLGVR